MSEPEGLKKIMNPLKRNKDLIHFLFNLEGNSFYLSADMASSRANKCNSAAS